VEEIASLVRYAPGGKANRTVAFISPHAGAGTTTCAANLAKYLADVVGAKVLLVDANLRHPSVHELAGVEQQTGLTELLTDSLPLSKATKPTTQPRLQVLTSGVVVDNAYRLLVPEALQEKLLDAASDYDFIILDCAPVNPYFESLGVAALCDGVLLVIEGEKTRRQPAEMAKSRLEQTNSKLLGVVMNKRKFYIPNSIYQRL